MPPSQPTGDKPASLELCEHCNLLGASSVIRSDAESTDVIYCSICNLSFHFVTEGDKLAVTQVQNCGKREIA
jgi:transcription elongation factor Elf1